jgi:Ran-binding protein 3
MGDTENELQRSKKRAAGRELSRDNPGIDDDDEEEGAETGTFKKASEEVLANRRIVKVRRHQTSSAPQAPSSNPFASIRLVPPPNSSATPAPVTSVGETEKTKSEEAETKIDTEKETETEKDKSESKIDEPEANSTVEKETVEEEPKLEVKEGEKSESEAKKDDEEKKENESESAEKNKESSSPFSSFQQLSSGQNAFTGLAGSGFSGSTFSFGSIPTDGTNSGSLFGLKTDQPSLPSFGFGQSNNGSSSLSVTKSVAKSETSGIPTMQEVPIETGEENEKSVFASDSVLFEFFNGGWKERGKGEVKVNISTNGTGKARLVMRSKGNYRLILNASLYTDMKLANMEKRGITFACINSTGEGQDGLSTFALKFKDASIVEEFREAVTKNKGQVAAAPLKTPENSPKADDE